MSKSEKLPELCKHGEPAGNCEKCQMSLEEAQHEANLLRAIAGQGGKRREDYIQGGESYPSRAEGLKNIKAEELSSTPKEYSRAEEILAQDRTRKGYKEMEEKLKENLETKPKLESKEEKTAKWRYEKAKFIADAQVAKHRRRKEYQKLKKEFEPEN